jgi:hypothetical protein
MLTRDYILRAADKPEGYRRLYHIRQGILESGTQDENLQWLARAIDAILDDVAPAKALQLQRRGRKHTTLDESERHLNLAVRVEQAREAGRSRESALDLVSAQEYVARDTLARHYKTYRDTARFILRLISRLETPASVTHKDAAD